MPIHPDALQPGLVIHNKHDASPRAFYELLMLNEATGKWDARQIATGKIANLAPDAIRDGYLAASSQVFCEVDFTALIGRRVAVRLKWGELSGEFQEVRVVKFAVTTGPATKTYPVPTHFVVEGDVIPVAEVEEIRPKE